MVELNTLQVILGLLFLVLGPAGGVWAGIKGSVFRLEQQMSSFVEQMRLDHNETRDWLKSLQEETAQNSRDIVRLDERSKIGGA